MLYKWRGSWYWALAFLLNLKLFISNLLYHFLHFCSCLLSCLLLNGLYKKHER